MTSRGVNDYDRSMRTQENESDQAPTFNPNIHVEVTTNYVVEQSDAEQQRYVFAYHITIRNYGHRVVKLLSRHWIITDGNKRVQEVKGDGVIGEQPILAPGEQFQYTSGVVLETPVGSMRGSYEMEYFDGTRFLAEIPVFTLAPPNAIH